MIRFDRVGFRYADRPVLAGVDLSVEEGELCLVAGRTGTGKSTLLRAVNGLVPHFTGGVLSGRVTVAGRDTRDHPPRELADVVGYVGQDPRAGFVTDVVEEELAYGMESLGLAPDVMRRRVEETLDLLGLAGLRDRPLGTLSGGQAQRVAIGSVLTAHPRVLVLDEPTSALDPVGAEDVLATVQRLVHDLGLTVLLAEHRLERVVHLADTVVLLPGGGRPPVHGPVAAVMAGSPVAPPVVRLGRLAGWSPLPLSVRDARRAATGLRERLEAAESRHGGGAGDPDERITPRGYGGDGAPPPGIGSSGDIGPSAEETRDASPHGRRHDGAPSSGIGPSAEETRDASSDRRRDDGTSSPGIGCSAGTGPSGEGARGTAPGGPGRARARWTGGLHRLFGRAVAAGDDASGRGEPARGGFRLHVGDRGGPARTGARPDGRDVPGTADAAGRAGEYGRAAGTARALASVRGLRVRYGAVGALNGVDLAVAAGEVVALMGRNGAGKSSLLGSLVGLVRPAGGRAEVQGVTPYGTPPREMVRRAGLVPQDAADLLYAETVAAECRAADRDMAAGAGTCAGLFERLAPGVDPGLHPRDLSEGQRLALALAVILTGRPPLVLLDEPTRGLDYAAKARLTAILRDLAAAGHGVVLATHDVELVAEVATRTVVLAEGEVVADGPTAAVVVSSPAFAPQVGKVLAPLPFLTVEQVEEALA